MAESPNDEFLTETKNSLEEDDNAGYNFYKNVLHSPKFVVAPMVDQSELAWRMLSRKYGAELCYTPMLHATIFIKDINYRKEGLQTCDEDKPLIVQFCANDPQTLLQAAQLAEPHCDAIDLNLGCPQVIAKRGHYGAFLQDEWDLIAKMVKTCHENLKIPITCKIRVFPSVEKTVSYAKMLEEAGCQILTVHGRTREQKGRQTGLANWNYIKAVRKAVKIPVFANGNIQYLEDVHRCLQQTEADAVMSAEGNLHNPALFHGKSPYLWDMVYEYLDFVEKYPCPLSYMRGHVFKLCAHALNIHRDVRELVASARSVEQFREAAQKLSEACQENMEKFKEDPDSFTTKLKLPLPYWICQPYVRPSPGDSINPEHKELRKILNLKRMEDMQKLCGGDTGISHNKLKKMLKHPHKNFDPNRKQKFDSCKLCPNPKSQRCEFLLCKFCCRSKCSSEDTNCPGHNHKKKDIQAEKAKLGLKAEAADSSQGEVGDEVPKTEGSDDSAFTCDENCLDKNNLDSSGFSATS